MMYDYLLASMLCAYGMAVALVEKRHDWPIRPFAIRLRRFIHRYVSRRFSRMLLCTVCTSFWMALVVDLVFLVATGGSYFMWPLSGFATLGLTWTAIGYLNALDYR